MIEFLVTMLIIAAFVVVIIVGNKIRRAMYRYELRVQAENEIYHQMNAARAQQEAAAKILKRKGQKP